VLSFGENPNKGSVRTAMANISKIDAGKWVSACTLLILFTAIFLFPGHTIGRGSDEAAKPGWHAVPHSSLESVCPAETAAYDFRGRCKYVIAAWSGGVADTNLNRLIIWGGGHADYAGNEVYAFDLNSLNMQRLNDPSPVNATSQCVETLSDGKPNSRHTYAGLACIAHANRMFSFGGSLNGCGFFGNETWTLDLSTLTWKNMKPQGGPPAALPGAIADYDPNSRKVFLHDTRNFWEYDYDANRYRKIGPDQNLDYHMNGVIDPKRKMFFAIGAAGSAGGGLKAISIGSGSNYSMRDWTTQATATCEPLLKSGYPGLAYDSTLDRIVGWPNFGDVVYLFDPDTKSCATESFPGGPPDSSHQGGPKTSNGTYGRLRYFPTKDVFVLVNDAGNDAYILRLNAAQTSEHRPDEN
jgi:hypothetical protein